MKYITLIILLLTILAYRPFGDVNGDYRVSIIDLVIAHRIVLKIESTPLQRIRADLNKNGVVDKFDMNILHTFLLNK